MIVGVIGAGTMGAGIAQAFAMTDGYEVRLCDIKQEFADGGKARIEKNINFLVGKEKITAEKGAEILGKIQTGLKDIWIFIWYKRKEDGYPWFSNIRINL
jgi:3-hydroxybutyryl-CoA dehydrogenase